MKATVKWVQDVQFIGETGSGHSVVMEGPEKYGGHGTAARPMEMILLGLGGCTSFDVIHILKKSRQAVEDCVVSISAERSDKTPKVFTKIQLHYTVTGHALNPKQVRKAIELSAEKYCSASIMLGKSVEIVHDFDIIESTRSN